MILFLKTVSKNYTETQKIRRSPFSNIHKKKVQNDLNTEIMESRDEDDTIHRLGWDTK